MYVTYDEYLEANRPKYIQTCPCCKKEYYSNDGDGWVDEDGESYNSDPVSGSGCINCETEKALHDPEHWAAQEVLISEKALTWVIHDTIRYSGDDREQVLVRLYKLLLGSEDYKESFLAYLDEHYSDVREQVEDKL